ncbi:DUF2283 domain-containing protein [Nodosilinea sp. LEGE 06152]|uniref:DUF2283 domain-containing protein n=1 Tax=Nodosilinea sp. LEGE 06152 TaxID=2777966 RepID=UPI001D144FA7|nr:DUF2283 domain-containing protein [Nodosilinea sp. LEGE 06152]
MANRPSPESEVLNENLIIDFDDEGRLVGTMAEHYSRAVTTPAIEVSLPGELLPTLTLVVNWIGAMVNN